MEKQLPTLKICLGRDILLMPLLSAADAAYAAAFCCRGCPSQPNFFIAHSAKAMRCARKHRLTSPHGQRDRTKSLQKSANLALQRHGQLGQSEGMHNRTRNSQLDRRTKPVNQTADRKAGGRTQSTVNWTAGQISEHNHAPFLRPLPLPFARPAEPPLPPGPPAWPPCTEAVWVCCNRWHCQPCAAWG